MTYLKGHWQLIAILVVVFALWSTPVVLPLKILIVFLHELAHALMTLLTGGEVLEMSISAQQGGHVISRGGSRFLILTAGYLGSLVIGVGLLLAALRTRADRVVVAVFGMVMLGVAVLYMRDFFALGFTLATGLALLAMSRYLPNDLNDMTLRIIGLSSLVYVPFDIFDDTIRRSGARSDAYMLAEEFGGPTMLWGGLWLVLSGVVIVWCLRHILGQDSNLHVSSLRA
ncbi:MAG: M50 family metallopeptidase [Roseovarius sp.]